MSDDESTHPIDIEALEKARKEKERAKVAQELQEELPTLARQSNVDPDELYPSDEMTAVGPPSNLEPEEPDPSSVTNIDIAKPVPPSAPRTVPAPEVIQQLAAQMDDSEIDLEDLATQTRLPEPKHEVDRFGPHSAVTRQHVGPHPADITDATAMGRLGDEEVRAAFAAADAEEARRQSALPIDTLDLDSNDLESVKDLDDLPKSSGELPRFDLDEDEHDVHRPTLADLEAEDHVPTMAAGVPSQEMEVLSGEAEIVDADLIAEVEGDDDSGPTATEARPPVAMPAPIKKPAPAFVPPASLRPIVPAYAVDPDSDEEQLQDEGSFQALLDLYKLRMGDAESRTAKVSLHHRIASVLERLDRKDEAWDELVTAFEMDPTDDAVAESVDRVGKELGRIGEIAERAKKSLHTADPETRLALLGHIVFWYERVLGRGSEVERFGSEIERLDKAHPVVLKRAAQNALASGDPKLQRDLLVRALDRTARREEKVALHLTLAGTYAGGPDAARHYEAALAIDPASTVALQGIERLGRDQEKHAQVEWALERLRETAQTASEKVDALSRLAELQEVKFLRRERAAELYEQVLELEPANPIAMKALERCYHALRDWPKLARTLRTRAENTYDKKTQAELLELAAEVYEAKIGDPTLAIEVYRDLLHADPKHRRALADLSRLYEKIGDWGNVANFKSRLAELASTKRQASRELVALGDFLNAPERDAIAAKLQYERAAAVDPTNASAWEALQRLAVLDGDDRKVVQCLEQRAKALDVPRQRAAVLVELARFHDDRGDARGAAEAWADAVKSDPTNEAAAAVMLDTHTRAEEWADAAPLCELLVNAAIRDKDDEALFTRLRLQTRIAAALGDPDRAMNAAISALEARPDDTDAQADLVAVCAQCREVPAIVARAKDWLARIASGPVALTVDALVRLAQLQRDAGEFESAVLTLERAHDEEGDNPDVLRELAEVYLSVNDFPHACKMIVDLARNATTADDQFTLFVEAAEIWAKRAGELEKAATLYEEARAIKPHDHWLLHTLMAIYGELGKWDALSGILEAITHIQESPERKAKSIFATAVVVREKVGDALRAADLFDSVLDIDKRKLEAFEEVVRTLTAVKDWEALERAYRKMLGRIKDDDEPNLKFALFQQLGLVYRDRLEDASRAYESFEAAARIKPEDVEVRKIVTELLVVSDNLDNAVQRTREMIDRDPYDPELFAELYDLFLRQHYFDKAWCAVNVLQSLRPLTVEQQRFHEDYAPMDLSEVPGQIVEQAWTSHVFHADLDPTLTELFAIMTPAVARMRHGQLRPEQAVGRPFTPAHSGWHEALHQTFANAAEILGLAPPEMLLGDAASPVPIRPALAPYGALLVSVPALEASADSFVYLVGKRLAEQRPELTARAFFPSVPDLTSLLAAAVRVGKREGAKDAAGAALDESMSRTMRPDERDGIRTIVLQAAMEGGVVDVKRWLQAADLSSMRAALLLCGDVEQARRFIVAEPLSAADLPPRERIGELYKFATSDLYSDLRGAIGVAVQD
jgi:tetratricopeptide (TPR) repeat protein